MLFMAYLRVKSIRGQKYLYLVKSTWDAKKKDFKAEYNQISGYRI